MAIGVSPQYNYSFQMVTFFPGQLELAEIFGDFNVIDKFFAIFAG